jgi:signal transduction histidine kinase
LKQDGACSRKFQKAQNILCIKKYGGAMNAESIAMISQLNRVTGTGAFDSSSFPAQVGCEDSACGHAQKTWCDSQSELFWMANRILAIQENERRRIASDLHDGLGQSLTMLKFAVAETERLLANGETEKASESLQFLKIRAQNALNEVRQVAMNLRPPMLDDLGILPTLTWFFRELETVCPKLKVEKDIGVDENSIPGHLKIEIFRILQEATSNIVKHAKADLIRFGLGKSDDALHFSIEDNGEGFDFSEVAIRNGSSRGLGLLSMKERASLSGGQCVMDSKLGQGTRICISWEFDKLAEAR